MIPVGSSRELISISIAATAKGRLNLGARVNRFAMTGVKPIPATLPETPAGAHDHP